jgi:hypothetical protein
MPRARNIKPAFFKNEILAGLPPHARLLFIGLWCLADRRGILEDRPARIRAELFPYEPLDADELLSALADAGFVRRYETPTGQRAIFIPSFSTHQNPHHSEKPSDIPAPDALSRVSTVKAERTPVVALDKHGANPGLIRDLSEANTVVALELSRSNPADSLLLIPDSLSPVADWLTERGLDKGETVSALRELEQNFGAEAITEAVSRVRFSRPAKPVAYLASVLERMKTEPQPTKPEDRTAKLSAHIDALLSFPLIQHRQSPADVLETSELDRPVSTELWRGGVELAPMDWEGVTHESV